jgi:K+/H+ antiporter YhaU regulatory subunit KhtT
LIPTKNSTLSDMDIWNKTESLLLGIKKIDGEYIVNPKKEYKIELSDKLIVLGTSIEINELKKLI